MYFVLAINLVATLARRSPEVVCVCRGLNPATRPMNMPASLRDACLQVQLVSGGTKPVFLASSLFFFLLVNGKVLNSLDDLNESSLRHFMIAQPVR